MRIVFNDPDLEYIYEYGKEKGKPTLPVEIIKGFIKKVNLLADVENSAELRMFKGVRYEKLSGNLEGYESIRINDRYRILLRIRPEKEGAVTVEVSHIHEIADYH